MFVIPKSNQYKIGNDTYFYLNLPAEAKITESVDKNGKKTYASVTLRDLQLNENNLKILSIKILKAICNYILNIQVVAKSSKKDLIKIILDTMQYE